MARVFNHHQFEKRPAGKFIGLSFELGSKRIKTCGVERGLGESLYLLSSHQPE